MHRQCVGLHGKLTPCKCDGSRWAFTWVRWLSSGGVAQGSRFSILKVPHGQEYPVGLVNKATWKGEGHGGSTSAPQNFWSKCHMHHLCSHQPQVQLQEGLENACSQNDPITMEKDEENGGKLVAFCPMTSGPVKHQFQIGTSCHSSCLQEDKVNVWPFPLFYSQMSHRM
jgi:hypothetical protein